MIAALNRYPVISVLGAVAVVLLAIVAFELAAGSMNRSQSAANSPQRVAAVEVKLLPPVDPVSPEQAYPETGTRPLFTPTRRPAPEAAAVAAASIVKGQFILTGVTIAGPLRIALLREKSSGRAVRVEKGKDVNGMTVAEIEPDRVVLAQGGEQETLSLQIQKGTGAAPNTAPGAAAPAGPFAGPASEPAPTAPPPPAPAPQPQRTAPTQNPAARPQAGFGPFVQPAAPTDAPVPATANPNQAMPLTPEELLARRRARRNQPSQ
jgi:type II secretory pathway component PulC